MPAAKNRSSRPKPRLHHGYAVFLFILGTLFPPLAVAARFGIGGDFWLNLLLTLCGYIPGHAHNFYIQNIRNNKTHKRTPKWAQRYGLVDTSKIKRDERKSQWASRYNDRLPESTHQGQAYEDGQAPGSSVDVSVENGGEGTQPRPNDELWRADDESYYGQAQESGDARQSSGRWHYPANFEDTLPPDEVPRKNSSKKKKKEKKDRWARTEDAYTQSEERSKKKAKRPKKKTSLADGSLQSGDTTPEFPEDPAGGLYGERDVQQEVVPAEQGDDIFKHQF